MSARGDPVWYMKPRWRGRAHAFVEGVATSLCGLALRRFYPVKCGTYEPEAYGCGTCKRIASTTYASAEKTP